MSSVPALPCVLAPAPLFVSPKKLSVRSSVSMSHRLCNMPRSGAAPAGGAAAALGSARPRRVTVAAAAGLRVQAVFYRAPGQQPPALLAAGDARPLFFFSRAIALVSVTTFNYTYTCTTFEPSSIMPQIQGHTDTRKYPTLNVCKEMKTSEHISSSFPSKWVR